MHSDMGPRSCLFPCEPLALPKLGKSNVKMTPILGDFGIMTPLDEPVVPRCQELRGSEVE